MWTIEGKTVIVTGANSGIGKVTAQALAERGAHIVMVCRSRERGEAAQAEIIKATGSNTVDLMLCDLASFESIRAFATAFNTRYDSLHVLLNNAGMVTNNRRLSEDGHEMQFAVNHLGPFLLTKLLLDKLKATAARDGEARIINVSSGAHAGVDGIQWDDIGYAGNYRAMKVYSQTKLMNILHVKALAQRLEGTGVTANALHPGAIDTNLARESTIINFLISLFFKSTEKGAATPVYVATAPELSGVTGAYFSDEARKTPAEAARSLEAAERLWVLSEELTSG